MKLIKYVTLIGFVCGASLLRLAPVSLDGTAGASVYESANYVFANGDFARGFVRLNGGFTIPAASTVSFNVLMPVAGTIDLNGTGQVTLEGDLFLANNATLSTGGIIDGQGNAVLLNGNFTIPAGQSLEFASDTIIDGQGHELFLQPGVPGGQLFINGPSGTTVTFRNMEIRGLRDFGAGARAILFGANPGQKVIFENVVIHLNSDYVFTGGELEINGFVKIDGCHTFEFNADQDLIIRRDSTFFLDVGTTFKYNPSDKSRIHIVMFDCSSRFYWNGCIIEMVEFAGLRLSKGHLLIDHKTIVQGPGADCEGHSLAFGTGIPAQDLKVDIFPGAVLDLNQAYLTYDNQD